MSVLLEIRKDLGACTRCALHEARTRIVFGEGPRLADLLILTGAPRFTDDKRGRPFAGNDGDMLDAMLENVIGLTRGEVYLAPVVKCRPKNGAPDRAHVAACAPFVSRQVAAVAPRVVLVMGNQAVRALWPGQGSVAELRGQWRTYQGIPTMVTYHPAHLLKSPEDKGDTLTDLELVRDKVAEIRAAQKSHPAHSERALRGEIGALRQRNQDLVRRALDLQQQVGDLQRRLARAAAPRVVREAPAAPVPSEVLSDLIRLCHPDRHANSDLGERANRATQWLLSQRKTRSRS